MKKKLIIIMPIIIALSVFLGLYGYLNYKDEKTNLTILEKRWISNNSETKYDLEIVNNVPIYSSDGNGVIFNFIDNFELDTGLEFNKISYLKGTEPKTKGLRIRILNNDTTLTDKDLLIFEDGYIAISSDDIRYDKVQDIKNEVIGVFTDDVGELSYYLKTGSNLTYKSYDDITKMLADYDAGNLTMIIVPQILYLNETMAKKDYNINYYFTEISKKVVLTLTEDNSDLNNVVKKYFEKWKKEEYVNTYNKEYLSYYANKAKMNDKTKADLISKTFTYGYVENAPYEVTVDGVPSGIAAEYIARMQRLTNIDFNYKKYKNVDELKEAINKGEVDIYFNNFAYKGEKYLETSSSFVEEYVVLGSKDNRQVINTFEGLKNKKVNMLKNSTLTTYFKENSKAKIQEVNSLDKLIQGKELIVIDKEIYDYYQNSKFSSYEVLYNDRMTNDYNFMIKNNDENFYQLFNYIIKTNSYYNYRISGLESLNLSLLDRTTFEELYLIVLGIILLPLLVLTAIYIILKRKKKIKEVRKEDRRKYTDILTSLKNRNYLNLNMEAWESSKVYPQAVVIIDLNNVKYVNDNYGHEAGDQLIVTAASILVNTQLENSEIIRTDGNEFLVYLVGYSEKQIDTYSKKLVKEMKELPHGFGAAIGYSMITDDIKTIDDAINEATLYMKTAKEKIK